MAEFCKECFKDLIMTSEEQQKVNSGEILLFESSWDDLCEGCGRIVPVVISVKNHDEISVS